MNLLRNYTGRDEKSLIVLMSDRYDLEGADFITSRDEQGRIIIKVVCDKVAPPVTEVKVTADGLRAYLDVYPGVNTGSVVTADDIMVLLQHERITVNINREAINNVVRLASDGGISEKVLIAEGVEPIAGKNSQVVLNFEPVNNAPKVLNNGRVDYRNVDNIRVVNEGDLLLTKKPATAGVRGLTVRNEEIQAEPGTDTEIYTGEGVRSEKDNTEFYALTDGCVTFVRNTLEVSPVYTVRGNVDYSTGNIVFNGNVYVKNDVLSNFTVKAEKDIFIEGVCQDAIIESGGNVVIKLGVRGDGKGMISAKGDVFIGYAENTLIEARGNIEVLKYAFNSRLRAGGKISAIKDPGIIAGGEVTAFEEIQLLQAGTAGNSRFTISVGTKFYFEKELEELKLNKDKFVDNKAKIDEFLGSVNLRKKEVLENPKVRQLIALRKQLDGKIAIVDAAMQKLIREAHHPRPKLKVRGELYGGIDVQVYRERVSIRENQKNMVYFFDDKYQRIQAISLEDKEWDE
ncbi:FapA family protein [Seleniivibrio sp.]|uniref:DUF342 domain-containing protein n=1 Tax=Seleniivibrio sp. TaxID=2898801 RepID=UPI0025D57F59|nr:FapA family protein [Seleniivibrio sp.]MCD8553925.1 FapA family protein [Seleniivibrio sp.]